MSRFEAARDAQEPVAGIWSVSVKPTDIFKTGTAEMLVLLLLWEGDCHGYDLSQRLRDRSGGRLTAQDGSLYPVLRRLESDGLISGKEVLVKEERRDAGTSCIIWRRAERRASGSSARSTGRFSKGSAA